MIENEEKVSNKKGFLSKLPSAVLIFCVLVSFLSQFQMGFSIGVMNSSKSYLSLYLNSTKTNYTLGQNNSNNKTCHHLDSWFKDCLVFSDSLEDSFFDPWSVLVSSFTIGGFFGSIIAYPLSHFLIGRKFTILVVGVMFTIAYILEVLFTEFTPFLIGRIIAGIASGISCGTVSNYLNEISPTHLRGLFGFMVQFSLNCGTLISQTISIFTSYGQWWRFLYGFPGITSILQTILAIFIPFSPRWLISKNEKYEKFAKKNLQLIRNKKNVDEEFSTMSFSMDEKTEEFKMPTKKIVLHLIISVALNMLQQFSGINAIAVYSTLFFQNAGITFLPASVITVILSFLRILFMVIMMFIVDKVGRKPLLLGGMISQLVSLVIVTGALSALKYADFGTAWNLTWGIITVIFVLIYSIGFAAGLGPIPWFVFGELFSTKLRTVAGTISTLSNWLSSFIVTLSFPYVNQTLSQFSFLPFAFVLLIGIPFVAIFFKETKGKTIEEICYGEKIIIERDEELVEIEKKEETEKEECEKSDKQDKEEKPENNDDMGRVGEEEKTMLE